MQAKKLLLGAVMAASLGVVLTGCSSGTTTPSVAAAPTSPLDTASQSVPNFIAYIQSLVSSDSVDPVVIDALTAPSDETAEPIAVSS